MTTLTEVLTRANVTVPDDLIADIDVPVLSKHDAQPDQRQGDVLVWLRADAGAAELDAMSEVPAAGVPVVVGEATGNTHMIQPEPGGKVWFRRSDDSDLLSLGVVCVPAGSTAWLIHTDEHGANGLGEGTWLLKGKRELADEVRRVAD